MSAESSEEEEEEEEEGENGREEQGILIELSRSGDRGTRVFDRKSPIANFPFRAPKTRPHPINMMSCPRNRKT